MGIAMDSIVSNGSIVSGGRVTNSVLSPDVRVNSYTEIDSSILFSHVDIGRYSRVRRAIIDRHIHIPEHTEIGYNPRRGPQEIPRDRYRYRRRRSRRSSIRGAGVTKGEKGKRGKGKRSKV